MQRSTLASCSLLVALLPWSLAPQESGAPLEPRPRSAAERRAARTEKLLGAWQLVSAKVQGTAVPALDVAGYLLVVEDYLALEIHLVMPTGQAADSAQPFFQSGIRRWRFDGDLRLETSALIGNTNINPAERWDFDPPGTKTTFDLVLDEVALVLERPGDSQLTFRRLPRLPFPGDKAEELRGPRKGAEKR